jgi:YVTN family beta-propeller protein
MSIKGKLSRVLNSKDEDDDDQQPYIGPRAFRTVEADRLRFSGRDTEIDEIVALITSHRIVLIYAQSGAGKTSIINAGVIPSLAKDGFEVLPVARVQVTSLTSPISPKNGNNNIPSKVKNMYIYNALQSLGREKPEIKPESILDLALFEFLDRYFPTRKNENGEIRPQVLIFDQLEELFSFYPDNWIEQQRNFFQQVADSLDNNPFLRVIFIIREDFLAQLDPFRSILPEKLRARFRLERLRRREATSAIKKPLKKVLEKATEDEKANIESEINALVNELRRMNVEVSSGDTRPLEGEFIEPIQLQVVCRRWWREREAFKGLRNKITSTEELGSVDKALEDFYEDAILTASKQTGVHESKIRIWCQEKLITSSGTRSMVHRGQKTTEGIDNNVIDWLERKYLIRKEYRSGASWYELTHDRLIKPIISSNEKWKDVNNVKKNRKIIITSGLAVAAATIVIISVILPFINPAPPPTPPSFIERVVPVGNSPTRVDVNPDTAYTYVANAASESISAISGQMSISSGQKNRGIGQQTIPANAGPENIAVNPTTNNDTGIGQQTIPLDTGPQFIAVNPNTNTIYAASYDSNTVSIINGTRNRIVGSIAVGDAASDVASDVAVNPNTNTIYVANYDSSTFSVIDGTLSVINSTTNSIVGSIAVGSPPTSIAVNPTTNTIYVASYDSSTVSVIDGTTNSVMGSIAMKGASPSDVAVNPNTNTIYVAESDSNTVSIINGTTNSVMGSPIAMEDASPTSIAVNPNTNTIYVASYDSNITSVIDGTTNSIVGSIAVGSPPTSIAVNPTTNTIYVASYDSSTVSVIDGTTTNGTTNSVMGSIAMKGASPSDVAVNPNTNTIYVASYDSSTVSVIDGTTTNGTITTGTTISSSTNGLEPEEIVVGSGPDDVAVNPNTNTIYVSSFDLDPDTRLAENGTVSIINGATNSIVKKVPVNGAPTRVAVHPTTNTIYVSSYYVDPDTRLAENGTVSVINGTTNSIVGSIAVGSRPTSVAVHPTTNTIYVSSFDLDPDTRLAENGTVSIINGATNSIVRRIDVGSAPNALAVHPTTNTIYVSSFDLDPDTGVAENGTVSVIDGTTTNGTITTGLEPKDIPIPLHAGPPQYIAINPTTNTIYAISFDSNTFYTLNSITNSLGKVSRVDKGPNDVAVNPNTNTIYVASYDSSTHSSTVSVINGATNSIVKKVPVGSGPSDVAVNPNTNTIYVSSFDLDPDTFLPENGTVSIINGATISGSTISSSTNGLEPEEIVVGSRPNDVAVNPNTNTIYVAESDSNTVSIINGTTNSVMGSIAMKGASPTSIAVNPTTNTIYVANTLSNTVSVINGTTINGTTTNSVMGSIAVGSRPTSIAVNPNTNMIYVANTLSNTLSVINSTTNSIVGSIAVGSPPTSIAVNPNTNTIYVASYDSSTVSVIDGTTNSVMGSPIAMEDASPTSIAVNPNTNTIYVASYDSSTVSVINGATNSIVKKVPVNGAPSDVAVNPTTNTIYVTNEDNDTLSIITVDYKPD